MAKISKEKWKTYGNVFDEFALNNLFKLASQGYFEDLVSSVSLGKEANIFTAVKKDGSHIVVKIYRTMNCNFNAMFNYIKSDPRYMHLKGQKRKIIFEWVRREFRNLLKAREVGLTVPTPIHFKDNIILMELIGKQNDIAPQAKNATIDDPQNFIELIIEQMKMLYQKGRLVHADLSMYNILVLDQKPIFIDMSQSTSVEDPHAKEYLKRDINNIAFFAKRIGVELDIEETMKTITST